MQSDLEKHKDRALALDRALKFSKLFKKDTFIQIQNVLNVDPSNYIAFKTACAGADLSEDELRWLHNYLKNYNKEHPYMDPEETLAASTPW